MPEETSLDIRIRPGIDPRIRHQIEDALEGRGFDVAGGGGFTDGSESDIMVYVANPKSALPKIVKILHKANVGEASVILQTEPHEIEHRVYQDGESPAERPWWKFW